MTKKKLTTKQKAMVEALEKSLGVVTTATRSVGVLRQSHYDWCNNNETYKDAVNELSNVALDFAESKLHKLIQDGDTAATIFYMKTKGRNRGYQENKEIFIDDKRAKIDEVFPSTEELTKDEEE